MEAIPSIGLAEIVVLASGAGLVGALLIGAVVAGAVMLSRKRRHTQLNNTNV